MIASIVGVDLEVLRKCGHASWSAVFSTFVLVLLSFTWQTVLFSSAAAVMVGGGEFHLSHLALAILLSAILTLSELLVIVGPSWVQHGISSLAHTGRFKAPPSKGSIIRLAFVIAGRFASVMLTANFFAVVACLLAFDQDTRRVIARWHSDANAQIVLEATSRQDRELAESQTRQAELRKSIATIVADQRRLGQLLVDPTASDPELSVAVEAVAQATAARAEAERERVEAEKEASEELSGKCNRPGRSCKVGAGPKYRGAVQRISTAGRAVADAQHRLDQAETKLRELRRGRTDELQRKGAAARTQLAEATTEKESAERQLGLLVAADQQRAAQRDQAIRQAIENDPRHVKPEIGLLARLRALRELMKEPAVATLVYIFEGMLIVLELSMLAARTLNSVPLEYATEVALIGIRRDHEAAKRLTDALAALDGKPVLPPPPAPAAPPAITPSVPQPPPVPPGSASGPQSAPTPPPAGNPRHAPRWKPGAASAGAGQYQTPPSPPGGTSGNGKTPPSTPAA
jgi:hypothetical protein